MKLSTRVVVSYLLVFILFIVLTAGMVLGLSRYSLDSLQKKLDLDKPSFEMILDPLTMMSHIASSQVEELQNTAQTEPQKLEDEKYLSEKHEALAKSCSALVLYKGQEILFSGLPQDSTGSLQKDEKTLEGDRSIYVLGKKPYYVREIRFTFPDTEEGSLLVCTDIRQIMDQSRDLFVRMIFLSVCILVVLSICSMMWLYRGIIRPIGKLKAAAENITTGNLNVSVTAESDDEIGELCNAFEAMRIKLKGQIEQNIQYEKDSKELISNISHDLKTPMTSIKGYIEGLMDGVADTPEKREKYIRTIYNKVNDMNSLIEELFLYAKLDSHSVSYSFVKLNISDYFQDCAEEISLDLEAQGVEFGYFNYLDKSTVIIADPEQLKRVINNIVGNSVKYAYPGRPLKVSIRVMEEAEFIKVEIEDNGRGISRREVPLIFDRLYRTDESRNSTKGGSGLGLSIAKKIIEEHGGKIWARSVEGAGTTMSFVLRKYREEV